MYVNIHVSNIERHTKFADRCAIGEKCQPFLRSRFVSSKRPIACVFSLSGLACLFRLSLRKLWYITHAASFHIICNSSLTNHSYDWTLHNVTNWKGSEEDKQKIIYDLKEVSIAARSDTIPSGNLTHQFLTHSDVSRTCSVSIIRELIALLALFRIVLNGMFLIGRHYFRHT
jgi:hypothetical protein